MAFPLDLHLPMLPTEILVHIFSFLDTPALSKPRIHDKPCMRITSVQDSSLARPPSNHCSNRQKWQAALKSLSLTCKLFRRIVFPHLFKHVRQISKCKASPISDQRFDWGLDFWDMAKYLEESSASRYIESFTLVIEHTPAVEFSDASQVLSTEVLFNDLESQEYAKRWHRLLFFIAPRIERITILAPLKTLIATLLLYLPDCEMSAKASFLHVVSLERTNRSLIMSKAVPLTHQSGCLSDCQLSGHFPCAKFSPLNLARWHNVAMNGGQSNDLFCFGWLGPSVRPVIAQTTTSMGIISYGFFPGSDAQDNLAKSVIQLEYSAHKVTQSSFMLVLESLSLLPNLQVFRFRTHYGQSIPVSQANGSDHHQQAGSQIDVESADVYRALFVEIINEERTGFRFSNLREIECLDQWCTSESEASWTRILELHGLDTGNPNPHHRWECDKTNSRLLVRRCHIDLDFG